MINLSIKFKANIYILEPSDIVYEGLVNIILKFSNHFTVYRIETIDELDMIDINKTINIGLINPIFLSCNNRIIQNLKKNHPDFIWIGIIYNHYREDLLQFLDGFIKITDTLEKIYHTFNTLLSSQHTFEPDFQPTLSLREIQVLKEIVKGKQNKEISDTLNISIHTVMSHRKNIAKKTGIKSISALTVYAITNKIIQLEEV
jgi:DNA-binding CsgD family transcriptional regulator